MELTLDRSGGISLVAISGELDASTAPAAQEQLVALAQPAAKIVLDLGGVPYMSSAGIRMLLATYRLVTGNGGAIVLANITDDVKDTMSVTGFLKFFTVVDSAEQGRAALTA